VTVEDLFEQDANQVMAENGRSFYFASLIFSSMQREKVAQLYRICRYIDDCADELVKNQSKTAMQNILCELKNPGRESQFQEFVKNLEGDGLCREHLNELVKGALFDIEDGHIESKKDLLIYCYRVAGVVGLMMCPLLGVKHTKAFPFAIDLGIGMQLTNICRDVLEDAQNGRNYLPAQDLMKEQITLDELRKSGPASKSLKELVRKYLDLADTYYESSYEGLAFISLRPRFCILMAGEIYRSIGCKIRRNGYEILRGRTFLNVFEKLFVVFKTLPKLFQRRFWSTGRHSPELHNSLIGKPGVDRG